jgi:hypothetical protein
MIFGLTIDTDSIAFGHNPAAEIVRILRNVATRIEREGMTDDTVCREIRGVNGNTIGQWGWEL